MLWDADSQYEFRDQLIAASLKLVDAALGQHLERQFRDQLIAASLKLIERRSGSGRIDGNSAIN